MIHNGKKCVVAWWLLMLSHIRKQKTDRNWCRAFTLKDHSLWLLSSTCHHLIGVWKPSKTKSPAKHKEVKHICLWGIVKIPLRSQQSTLVPIRSWSFHIGSVFSNSKSPQCLQQSQNTLKFQNLFWDSRQSLWTSVHKNISHILWMYNAKEYLPIPRKKIEDVARKDQRKERIKPTENTKPEGPYLGFRTSDRIIWMIKALDSSPHTLWL